MDPKATLRMVNNPSAYLRERHQAVQDLAEWINNGGFMPTGEDGEEIHPTITEESMDSLSSYVQEWPHPLAASLRVALAYGDDSGLKYLLEN